MQPEDKSLVAERCRERYYAMTAMDFLEQRDSCRKKNYETNLDIERILLDRETKDITHMDIVERRVALLQDLNVHLQEIIAKKEILKSRLQRPYVGEFLQVDALVKSKLVEMFRQIAPQLSELARNLEDISWAGKMPIGDGQLSRILDDMSAIVATLQTGQRSLAKMRNVVDELHQLRTPDVSRCDDRH